MSYFTERLDPAPTRQALLSLVRRAKRNKAFENCWRIGLAIDGTGAGWRTHPRCAWCRPRRNAQKEILGYQHCWCYSAWWERGCRCRWTWNPTVRTIANMLPGSAYCGGVLIGLGKRFAQYLVVDGEFATAPFLHAAGDWGLPVVARLKDDLPELFAAAHKRFLRRPPSTVFQHRRDRVEMWEADDFDPWDALRWKTVRVFFYRQHKPDETIVEACWLTNFPSSRVGAQALFHMAKSRWEIENEGFNEAKTRHGLEHISHHHANSLLIGWLLLFLALTIERLYRLRYLHRGKHPFRSAADRLLILWVNVFRSRLVDTS